MDELLRAGFAALGLPLDAAALARFQTYYTLLDERSRTFRSRCSTVWISACAFSATSAPPPASRT